MRSELYEKYMNSAAWRFRRARAIARAGCKCENRIENLELMTNAEHSGTHARRGEIGFGLHKKWGRKSWRSAKASW